MNLSKLFEKLKIFPNDSGIYWEALTHPSFTNEKKNVKNYQRLEFLGDAILGSEMAIYLFNQKENYSEGDMTVLKANFVNGKSLAKQTKKLKLIDFLKIGKGAESLKENQKVQADIYESLLGAIFIDQGIEKTKVFLKNTIFKDLKKENKKPVKNPKTLLQEHLQSENRKNARYENQKNQDHFVSKVVFGKAVLGMGKGASKKDAEIEAAKNALEKLNKG